MLCPLVVAVLAARASDIESQHAFDTALPLSGRLELLLHSRLRTRDRLSDFYQARFGPILGVELSPRLSLLAGYYYQRQEYRDGWRGSHRLFSGATVSLLEKKPVRLELRTLLERFLGPPGGDFNRYRQRLRLTLERRVRPYASGEGLFDAQGLRSTRLAAGLRWHPLARLGLDLSYTYEIRRASEGPSRHILLTSLHFRRRGKQEDPDL